MNVNGEGMYRGATIYLQQWHSSFCTNAKRGEQRIWKFCGSAEPKSAAVVCSAPVNDRYSEFPRQPLVELAAMKGGSGQVLVHFRNSSPNRWIERRGRTCHQRRSA
ncbi:hypothetical protein PsYK624_066480 [Phanerochaete sordida]|uniref:Uncharacterized protein n=1 Tax=Phanerochaete sordida TaxID=48140 RepID=A0A9P3LDM0_9APHY|nr:hypothetical protein PsYK624_066480 [Phanerochaete sordida]